MSMDNFVQTLTEEQKAALIKALSSDGSPAPEVESRWQHEEPTSEAVDGDFTMNKNREQENKNKRRPVQGGANTWEDTGEHSDVSTPDVKKTPRNRRPPKMKEVKCNSCGKTFKLNSSLVHGEYYRCEACIGR
tara:strand:- start:417 stop:815 length:399 start_codon:yes stop_codon:yes gene_type:complete